MPKPLRVLHSTKPYAQHDQDADAAGVVRLSPLNLTVRLSELVASLSIGTDIGMGQPEGQALRTCHLALAVAREMGLDQKQCADVYYIALLRFVGCNSHADQDAAGGGGDERAVRRTLGPAMSGEPQESAAASWGKPCSAGDAGERMPLRSLTHSIGTPGRSWPASKRSRSGTRS